MYSNFRSSSPHPAKVGRCRSFQFPEHTGERAVRTVTDFESDFRYGHVCRFQKRAGVPDSDAVKVFHEILAEPFLEHAAEMGSADMKMARDVGQGQIRAVVGMQIGIRFQQKFVDPKIVAKPPKQLHAEVAVVQLQRDAGAGIHMDFMNLIRHDERKRSRLHRVEDAVDHFRAAAVKYERQFKKIVMMGGKIVFQCMYGQLEGEIGISFRELAVPARNGRHCRRPPDPLPDFRIHRERHLLKKCDKYQIFRMHRPRRTIMIGYKPSVCACAATVSGEAIRLYHNRNTV